MSATDLEDFRCMLAGQPTLILGSSSSSRRGIMDELAHEHGFAYQVATADIDEQAIRHPDAEQLVLALAHAKAAAIRAKLAQAGGAAQAGGYLVTCDQVVLHEGRILEKPADAAQAREFISGYSRSPPSTVGSVLVTHLPTGATHAGVDTATIHFAPIPEDVVEALIAEGSVFWCAGGLMVEHALVAPLVTRMEGTLDSVMGLPKDLLLRLLVQASREAK